MNSLQYATGIISGTFSLQCMFSSYSLELPRLVRRRANGETMRCTVYGRRLKPDGGLFDLVNR